MASEKTSNIGLNKWVPSDYVKMDEFNENFDKIDEVAADHAAQLAETTSQVFVEKYKRQDGETDDTGRIQRAIDSAPPYATIVFDPKVEYRWTSVKSKKSLTFNINGAYYKVNPYATQTPAIYFEGDVGEPYLLTADAAIDSRSLYLSGASSIFSKGDYVIVGDDYVTLPWASNGSSYTGRSEINKIDSVSGDTITLIKPVEWPYSISDGAYIKKITNLIDKARIIGASNGEEVNPGVESTGSPALPGKGHIFQFSYCLLPEVDDATLNGWQMHIVNFYRCVYPLARKVVGKKPFKPSAGGHGYVVRMDNCLGGMARENIGEGARHLVDWSRSYYGASESNLSISPFGVSYYTHGLGSKHIRSTHDQVIGSTTADEGWAMGDPQFSADFDFIIENPVFIGSGTAIHQKVGSKGMKIINPNIRTRSTAAIMATRGADDFLLDGGYVENFRPGTDTYAVLIQATDGDNPIIEYPHNVKLRFTKIKGNAMVKVEADGDVTVEDLEFDVNITANAGLAAALRVAQDISPKNLIIRRNNIKGQFDRGILGSTVPSGKYTIEQNTIDGYRTNGTQLRAGSTAGNLRYKDNVIKSNGSAPEIAFSSEISDAIKAGAVVEGNFPNNTNKKGSVTLSSNGLDFTYSFSHGLMSAPRYANATAGNEVTGTAEILFVTWNDTKIIVRFKTNPPQGTDNIVLNWEAII